MSYTIALREMLDADGLLLFQGRTSNPAIPAKAYEYLRARRPILALADEEGETVKLLRRARVGSVAPIHDATRIEQMLEAFVTGRDSDAPRVLDAAGADRYSRIHRVQEFAALFDRLSERR